MVRTGAREPLGWRRSFTAWAARNRALPAAAAAVLVLGGAAALARLDVHYDQSGLTVRTGWGHAAPASAAGESADAAALRQELASLRGEIARLGASQAASGDGHVDAVTGDPSGPAVATPVSTGTLADGGSTAAQGAALLRSFRQALDESELRQQQNLQLRIGEITRDFDLQRRQDLVQVEQGFGRVETPSGSRCSTRSAASRWECRSSDPGRCHGRRAAAGAALAAGAPSALAPGRRPRPRRPVAAAGRCRRQP